MLYKDKEDSKRHKLARLRALFVAAMKQSF
jgi:hypothetical protein